MSSYMYVSISFRTSSPRRRFLGNVVLFLPSLKSGEGHRVLWTWGKVMLPQRFYSWKECLDPEGQQVENNVNPFS